MYASRLLEAFAGPSEPPPAPASPGASRRPPRSPAKSNKASSWPKNGGSPPPPRSPTKGGGAKQRSAERRKPSSASNASSASTDGRWRQPMPSANPLLQMPPGIEVPTLDNNPFLQPLGEDDLPSTRPLTRRSDVEDDEVVEALRTRGDASW